MRRSLSQVVVSAVLPVYNEAKVLERLAQRVTESIAQTGARYEVVFVNDGSTDASPEILDRLAEQDARIRVVHFSRNFGHQAAVQAGLSFASGDVVILMDSDLQDSPEAIGRFLREWQDGFDVVYAVRTDRKEAWWKRSLFSGFHRFLAAISSTPIPAHAGNFSLMDRRVVNDVTRLAERDRYLPGLRAWVGYRQKGLEVRRGARYDDQPRVSLKGLWRLAKTAIFSFSALPLAVFYMIGCSSLALFGVLSAFALYCKLFTTLAIPGWTSEMLVASFFGAVNAFGISILGEYVMRIYDQVRNRPIYLVARTTNVASTGDDAAYEAVLAQSRELVAMAKSERKKSASRASDAGRGRGTSNTASRSEKRSQARRKSRRTKAE